VKYTINLAPMPEQSEETRSHHRAIERHAARVMGAFYLRREQLLMEVYGEADGPCDVCITDPNGTRTVHSITAGALALRQGGES